jgi:hypothetical protein
MHIVCNCSNILFLRSRDLSSYLIVKVHICHSNVSHRLGNRKFQCHCIRSPLVLVNQIDPSETLRPKLRSFVKCVSKITKRSVSFVVSVCLSVCPYETTRLPLEGFSLNLVSEGLSKICRENSSFIKI